MFRTLFVLHLFIIPLLACKGGYNSCKSKIIDSKTIQNNSLFIPVSSYNRLVFSAKKPKGKILKYDPFLSLYLVKSTKKFKYPFKINNHLALGYASVNAKRSIEGKIIKQQIGLDSFAQFSDKITSPALLTNSCCSLEGIVTSRGIIQKAYIERFLKAKDTRYSDIGIRVKDINHKVVVTRVNIFKNIPLKKGDILISLNGKKIKNSASFMRKILFSKIGKRHLIKFKRLNKYKKVYIKSYTRYGGGYISDTFLENQGLYFSNDLVILKISDKFEKYGLKVGDRLLKINEKYIYSIEDLGSNLESFKQFSSLLFERDDFQFFVNIN